MAGAIYELHREPAAGVAEIECSGQSLFNLIAGHTPGVTKCLRRSHSGPFGRVSYNMHRGVAARA